MEGGGRGDGISIDDEGLLRAGQEATPIWYKGGEED